MQAAPLSTLFHPRFRVWVPQVLGPGPASVRDTDEQGDGGAHTVPWRSPRHCGPPEGWRLGEEETGAESGPHHAVPPLPDGVNQQTQEGPDTWTREDVLCAQTDTRKAPERHAKLCIKTRS